MVHRISLFVMFVTCVGLCALTGASYDVRYEAIFAGLPGGAEAIPSFTRSVLGLLTWLASWWTLCVALGAAVAFGGPHLLQSSKGGQKFLAGADAWMTKYQGTVVVVFVAAMFSIYWMIDLAVTLPWIEIMDQLTGG
ncbi:MAG: hypothetical protein ACYSX0_17280 [Planctomycetota bacterium]|jgi:type II secretory pathway component PulF